MKKKFLKILEYLEMHYALPLTTFSAKAESRGTISTAGFLILGGFVKLLCICEKKLYLNE
jgi:hypothetical protein